VAESAGKDQGARFTILLPTTQQKVGGHASAAPVRARDRQSLRILLVEDHEDTNRSLTKLLRRRGYEVEAAMSVRAALDLAASGHFDVLVSDIGLPDGSGIELMQALESGRPSLGIALTGFGMEEDVQRTQEVGFQHHLVKPVDLNKLDALIQNAAVARADAALAGAL